MYPGVIKSLAGIFHVPKQTYAAYSAKLATPASIVKLPPFDQGTLLSRKKPGIGSCELASAATGVFSLHTSVANSAARTKMFFSLRSTLKGNSSTSRRASGIPTISILIIGCAIILILSLVFVCHAGRDYCWVSWGLTLQGQQSSDLSQ